ncbi:hypothetical protein BSKO_00383 [Bryopsis sp. KO-2023]|nr:hypothetical protein BSKO_00383 [Bryopsis sp. KO-2023]
MADNGDTERAQRLESESESGRRRGREVFSSIQPPFNAPSRGGPETSVEWGVENGENDKEEISAGIAFDEELDSLDLPCAYQPKAESIKPDCVPLLDLSALTVKTLGYETRRLIALLAGEDIRALLDEAPSSVVNSIDSNIDERIPSVESVECRFPEGLDNPGAGKAKEDRMKEDRRGNQKIVGISVGVLVWKIEGLWGEKKDASGWGQN